MKHFIKATKKILELENRKPKGQSSYQTNNCFMSINNNACRPETKSRSILHSKDKNRDMKKGIL